MSSDSSAFHQNIRPMLAEMEASANAHDTDRHLAAYWRDPALVFVFNGEITRGWDALHAKQSQWWSGGVSTTTYAYVGEPVINMLRDDLGLTTVLIASRSSGQDALAPQRQLAFTALWKKQPEGWRIVWAHESTSR